MNGQMFGRLIFLQVLAAYCITAQGKSPPNVIFILADDLGWDDVGFHGSEIKTPNIDRLAQEGVILNNYYVQPICTPTRGSLLSGRYPIHTGLQHYVIAGSQPYGLPLSEVTIAQHLKTLGYDTHAVGKWHIGFFKPEYLPENRGFDSHFGIYVGKADYFDHYAYDGWHLGFFKKDYLPENRGFDTFFGYYMGHEDYFDHYALDGYMGYDLHKNGVTMWNESEVYSTELYTQLAESIIQGHDKSKPLFLYLAHQAVHVGNSDDKIQAPQKYVDRFPYIKNINRRMFAGAVSALDDSVGAVHKALSDAGMLNNTVIFFSTDNGGPSNGYDGNAACNWPLRGVKNTLWQGGTRGVGFVNSPLLQTKGYVNENLMHVTDWLPTIVDIAGGKLSALADVDGVSQWDVISKNKETSRKEVLLNIDPIMKHEALIVGDFKIIYGDISDGRDDGWYPPPSSEERQESRYFYDKYFEEFWRETQGQVFSDMTDIPEIRQTDVLDLIEFMNKEYELLKSKNSKNEVRSKTFSFLSETVSKIDSLSNNQVLIPNSHQPHITKFWQLFSNEKSLEYFEGNEGKHLPKAASIPIVVKCGEKPANASENCKPEKDACLFNIKDDPCEYNNLAASMPSVVKQLQARIEVYRKTMVPPGNKPEDPKGNPQLHGGVWVPWL